MVPAETALTRRARGYTIPLARRRQRLLDERGHRREGGLVFAEADERQAR